MTKELGGGLKYTGEVNIGETPHGFGTIYYRNGAVMYRGQLFRGRMEGQGQLFLPNGALAYQVINEQDQSCGENSLQEPFQCRKCPE